MAVAGLSYGRAVARLLYDSLEGLTERFVQRNHSATAFSIYGRV